jgi:hypothetical protein
MDDLPVAVVDAVATAPLIYCVQTDRPGRPVAKTNAGQGIACSWRDPYATVKFQPLPPRLPGCCQGVRRGVSVCYETRCFRKS